MLGPLLGFGRPCMTHHPDLRKTDYGFLALKPFGARVDFDPVTKQCADDIWPIALTSHCSVEHLSQIPCDHVFSRAQGGLP